MKRSLRLERVLRVREVEEELARADWMDAESRARAGEDAAAALHDARDQMVTLLGEKLVELPPSWVLIAHEQIDGVARRAVDGDERALTLRTQADTLRQPWQERRAAMKGLARLVERVRADELTEAQADEARSLDELTAARDTRQKRSER